MHICEGPPGISTCPHKVFTRDKYCKTCKKLYIKNKKRSPKQSPRNLIAHDVLINEVKYIPSHGYWLRNSGKKIKVSISTEKGSTRTRLSVRGRAYTASKLAVYWMTGEYPFNHVKFSDNDPTNLAWKNLYLYEPGDLGSGDGEMVGISPNFELKCAWPECGLNIYSNKSNYCNDHRKMRPKRLQIVTQFSKNPSKIYNCRGKHDLMFNENTAIDAAKLCVDCYNAPQCYKIALEIEATEGVWGGVLFH